MDTMDYIIDLNYPKNTLVEEREENEELKERIKNWGILINLLSYIGNKNDGK
jgi:hypothetical protein